MAVTQRLSHIPLQVRRDIIDDLTEIFIEEIVAQVNTSIEQIKIATPKNHARQALRVAQRESERLLQIQVIEEKKQQLQRALKAAKQKAKRSSRQSFRKAPRIVECAACKGIGLVIQRNPEGLTKYPKCSVCRGLGLSAEAKTQPNQRPATSQKISNESGCRTGMFTVELGL